MSKVLYPVRYPECLYNVPTAGPSELKLQIAITSDKTVLELKQAIAEKSDVEADRQRLIYSGSSSDYIV
jgi:Ubiquitin family